MNTSSLFFADDDSLRWYWYPVVIVGGLVFAAGALVAAGIGGIILFGGLELLLGWVDGWGGGLTAAAVFIAIFVLLGFLAD